MNIQNDLFLSLFHPPNWILEILSHPLLLCLSIVFVFLGWKKLLQKIKDGEIIIGSRIGGIIVVIGIIGVFAIAKLGGY